MALLVSVVVHVGLASTGRRDVHVCTAGPNWEAFGHSGAGGSMAFADPKARIAVGYVMNQMASNLNGVGDARGGWPEARRGIRCNSP